MNKEINELKDYNERLLRTNRNLIEDHVKLKEDYERALYTIETYQKVFRKKNYLTS